MNRGRVAALAIGLVRRAALRAEALGLMGAWELGVTGSFDLKCVRRLQGV